MKKPNYNLIYWLIFFLLLLIGMLFLFFYYPQEIKKETEFNIISVKEFKDDILLELKDLKRCGNWPFNRIDLNPTRGNPFSKKESIIDPMTASSSAECLSVDLIY